MQLVMSSTHSHDIVCTRAWYCATTRATTGAAHVDSHLPTPPPNPHINPSSPLPSPPPPLQHLEPVLIPPIEDPKLAIYTAHFFRAILLNDTTSYAMVYGNASDSLCASAKMVECGSVL